MHGYLKKQSLGPCFVHGVKACSDLGRVVARGDNARTRRSPDVSEFDGFAAIVSARSGGRLNAAIVVTLVLNCVSRDRSVSLTASKQHRCEL